MAIALVEPRELASWRRRRRRTAADPGRRCRRSRSAPTVAKATVATLPRHDDDNDLRASPRDRRAGGDHDVEQDRGSDQRPRGPGIEKSTTESPSSCHGTVRPGKPGTGKDRDAGRCPAEPGTSRALGRRTPVHQPSAGTTGYRPGDLVGASPTVPINGRDVTIILTDNLSTVNVPRRPRRRDRGHQATTIQGRRDDPRDHE